jgi:hypothetical protein
MQTESGNFRFMDGHWKVKRLVLGAGGVLSLAITIATTTSAGQATSNLASWAASLGLKSIAHTFESPVFDRWGFWLGIVLMVTVLFLAIRHWWNSPDRLRVGPVYGTLAELGPDGNLYPIGEAPKTASKQTQWQPMWKAVAHVRKVIGDTEDETFWPQTRVALRQCARDGDIHVRGRKQIPTTNSFRTEYSAIHTDISPNYWTDSEIGVLATVDDPLALGGVQTMPETPDSWHPLDYRKALKLYTDLRVNMDEVLALWPRSPSANGMLAAGSTA